MDLDAGPFAGDRLGDMAAPPDRRSFIGLVADALSDVPARQDALSALTATLPDPTAAHVDDVFVAAMGGAPDGLATAAGQLSSSPAGGLSAAGQVVPYRNGQVASFLPDPETQPSAALIAPPSAPAPGDGGPGYDHGPLERIN